MNWRMTPFVDDIFIRFPGAKLNGFRLVSSLQAAHWLRQEANAPCHNLWWDGYSFSFHTAYNGTKTAVNKCYGLFGLSWASLCYYNFSMWQIDEDHWPYYRQDFWNPLWSLDDRSASIREKQPSTWFLFYFLLATKQRSSQWANEQMRLSYTKSVCRAQMAQPWLTSRNSLLYNVWLTKSCWLHAFLHHN